MTDTREHILEVALDLFASDGYEKVSLREIAQRVGVTKPALYYYFANKEELFLALVTPVLTMSEQLARLLDERPTRDSWAQGCAALLDWILPRRKLLELLQNNQSKLHALGPSLHDDDDHLAMHQRLDALFTDESLPLDDRMRMAGCIGLVVGVLAYPGQSPFAHVPADELKPLLMAAIRDLLQVG
jgi:AcrR family transcriptional regulator